MSTSEVSGLPNQDYRDAREGLRREREVHLRQRRVSGEALEGGRSEAKTTLSSSTGLAETETIAENAVTAITEVAEAGGGIATSFSANDNFLVMEAEIVGGGYPVSIYYTERMTWSGTVTNYCYIRYRLRVIDPDDITLAEYEQRSMECTNGTSAIGNIYASPNLTIQADLTAGRVYRAQVHTLWNVTGVGDAVGTFSFSRVLRVTDLKR